jgi:hypothetical protein
MLNLVCQAYAEQNAGIDYASIVAVVVVSIITFCSSLAYLVRN